MLAVALTIACALALAGTLVAERLAHRGRYLAKPLASLAFIGVAVARGDGDGAYDTWILIGLVLGAGGDVALMFRHPGFLIGLVLFLLGHLAYVGAAAAALPPTQWLGWHVVALVAPAPLVLRWLWPHLGRMRGPVILYVLAITSMVIGAWSVLLAGDGDRAVTATAAALLAAGATLFFASDLAVARERFVHKGFVNRAWGLPAYYAGQLLLAWSVAR